MFLCNLNYLMNYCLMICSLYDLHLVTCVTFTYITETVMVGHFQFPSQHTVEI